MKIDNRTALEAKALVYLAFRSGPIESVHAGEKQCPVCRGNKDYSRISGPEMKEIMKAAVDRMATLLMLRENNPEQYATQMIFAYDYVREWAAPQLVPGYLRAASSGME